MEELRNTYRISIGRPKGKRPSERLRHRWKNTRTNVRVIGLKDVDLIHLAQDSE
jgi:hypothetical protein